MPFLRNANDKHSARCVSWSAAFVALSIIFGLSGVAARTTIAPLPLPQNLTIDPEGERPMMVMGDDTVAASATDSNHHELQRVVVWHRGSPSRASHLPSDSDYQALGAITGDGTVYVNSGLQDHGAMQPVFWTVLSYRGSSPRRVSLPDCGLHGYTIGAPIVEAASGQVLGLNFGEGYPPDFDAIRAGSWAPHAAVLDAQGCRVIGRATVRAIAGRFAAGFRGYLGSAMVPLGFNTVQQRFVAVIWRDGRLRELGAGVALGVNSQGVCVGATAFPGQSETGGFTEITTTNGQPAVSHTYRFAVPHAALWRTDGTRIVLETGRSVAYAIDGGERVIGMLQDPTGRHYAFLWQDGVLRRLEDIVRAHHWRFESAYAFTPDGGILGIGTHDGVASAFILHL
jgi:hypothetical protein